MCRATAGVWPCLRWITTSFSRASVVPSSSRLYEGRPALPMPIPRRPTTSLTRWLSGRISEDPGSVSRYAAKAASTLSRVAPSRVNAPPPGENRRSYSSISVTASSRPTRVLVLAVCSASSSGPRAVSRVSGGIAWPPASSRTRSR